MKKTKAHRVIPKSGMLFDEAVRAFAWVCKTNPRVSDVIRYYKKHNFTGRFDAKNILLFVSESGYNQSGFAEKLLAKGRKLDRNFERNVLRFRKKCGMGEVKTAQQLKAEINAAVARECAKPVTFVSCSDINNHLIVTAAGRNIRDVIDEMIKAIPATKKPLIEILGVIRNDSYYKAPEQQRELWSQCGDVLFKMIGLPELAWQKKVQRIFNAGYDKMNKARVQRIKALSGKYKGVLSVRQLIKAKKDEIRLEAQKCR